MSEDPTLLIQIKPSELSAIIRRELSAALGAAPEELLSTAQLAKSLDVSPDLVRLWVRERGCPHLKAGGKKFRFRRADVVDWMESQP